MLAIIRIVLLAVAFLVISVSSCLLCLIRPFHRNNVYVTAKFLHKCIKIFGVDVEIRGLDNVENLGPVVYVANHQNSYDIFTASGAVLPGTVSIGKKSLKWIPLFGQMYWLTGNILIDRDNKNKALGTIATTVEKIKQDKLSVWLFPEGTRSYGRGLLRFKTGAFRTAAQAQVPVVPICVSNTHQTIKLNRWNNGKIIIEYLAPVSIASDDKTEILTAVGDIHQTMVKKFTALNEEVACPLLD